MIKFVAFVALVLVAVSAKEYFKQPQMPCAYRMMIDIYEYKQKLGKYDIKYNGRYLKVEAEAEKEKYLILLRPDLGKNGNSTMTFYSSDDDECEVMQVEKEIADEYLEIYSTAVLLYADDKKWDNKVTKTYRNKKCDLYYDDDDEDDMKLYVYDDHIFAIVGQSFEYVFEYEYKAPMSDFTISKKDYGKCYEKEKKISDKPSEDYIMCAASSVKVALVAIFVALVSTLF